MVLDLLLVECMHLFMSQIDLLQGPSFSVTTQINLDVLLSNSRIMYCDIIVQVSLLLLFDQQKRGVEFTVYVTLYVSGG